MLVTSKGCLDFLEFKILMGKKGWYLLKYWEVLSSFSFVLKPKDSTQR